MAKKEPLHTAGAALIRALEMTADLLDGFPIPGAKGAITTVFVRFSGAATIEQYIVFVGARYKHVRCTNSKLRVLYTHDPPAK